MKSSPNALARRTRRPLAVVLAGMGVGVAVLAACALCLGPYTVSLGDTLSILASRFVAIPQTWSSMAQNVILEVRLPRILGALLVGASLAVAGAAYQGIFRNPLVTFWASRPARASAPRRPSWQAGAPSACREPPSPEALAPWPAP